MISGGNSAMTRSRYASNVVARRSNALFDTCFASLWTTSSIFTPPNGNSRAQHAQLLRAYQRAIPTQKNPPVIPGFVRDDRHIETNTARVDRLQGMRRTLQRQ